MPRIRDWFFPKKPTPEPQPAPEVVPPLPEPPVVKQSPIQLINYARALAILRSIPFKQLREEFFKLPLRKLGWAIGVTFWLYMTYAIVNAILGMLR